jgi:hypothetical protein
MWSIESQLTFRRDISPPSSESNNGSCKKSVWSSWQEELAFIGLHGVTSQKIEFYLNICFGIAGAKNILYLIYIYIYIYIYIVNRLLVGKIIFLKKWFSRRHFHFSVLNKWLLLVTVWSTSTSYFFQQGNVIPESLKHFYIRIYSEYAK